MTAALLLAILRRLGLPLIGLALLAVVLLSFWWLGMDACYVWALILVGALVWIQHRDGVNGSDPQLEAEEARERAERVAAIMRGEQ